LAEPLRIGLDERRGRFDRIDRGRNYIGAA
jgi:hypothetical protein